MYNCCMINVPSPLSLYKGHMITSSLHLCNPCLLKATCFWILSIFLLRALQNFKSVLTKSNSSMLALVFLLCLPESQTEAQFPFPLHILRTSKERIIYTSPWVTLQKLAFENSSLKQLVLIFQREITHHFLLPGKFRLQCSKGACGLLCFQPQTKLNGDGQSNACLNFTIKAKIKEEGSLVFQALEAEATKTPGRSQKDFEFSAWDKVSPIMINTEYEEAFPLSYLISIILLLCRKKNFHHCN